MIAELRRNTRLFLEYCRKFGFFRSCRFASARVLSRTKVRLANLIPGDRVACSCCGWSGRSFDDYIEVGYRLNDYVCPRCGSQPRHRYFHFWLQQSFGLTGRTGVSIVFAFERPLEALWKEAGGIRAIRADIEPSRGVDVIADIQALPFPGNCADLIWCHHVLEHVEDDTKGMSELRRVLKESTGTLVLSVPMVEGATTFEYGFADPAESGHRRRYGNDFERRLSEAGLQCQKLRMILSLPEMRRYGIRPDPFFVCTKTAA